MSNHYYTVKVDHYSGPTSEDCNTKKEVRPLIKKLQKRIFGGQCLPEVYKITTEDVSEEFRK